MGELSKLFIGSGSFIDTPKNEINTLIVDEAHRLTKQTGFLKKGDNQIREIIQSVLFSIFFIDEDQTVSLEDYGTIDEIKKIAVKCGATVHQDKLISQFRCNGSDGYLSWLNYVLQHGESANFNLEGIDYDFKVFDTPSELRDAIFEKNVVNNKSRLVAGYCWNWVSDKNPSLYDITFPDFNFKMRWNLKTYGSTWIIDPNSIKEVGCIHTCQGLEVEYIGVIIGDDLIVRNGKVLVQPSKRSKDDRTIWGWKKMMKENPDETKDILKKIIKNTYKTLLTRGSKGCYIYCTDTETNDYFKLMLNITNK